MSQQNIDFGSFPNDPSADPIRAAFQKVQNNFTELYTIQMSNGVTSLNVGPGLTQNRETGNVTIRTAFPTITIDTTNSNDSLLVGVNAPTSNTATITNSNAHFSLSLAPTITTDSAVFVNTTTGNLSVTQLMTDVVPETSNSLSLGSDTYRWDNLYLSGNLLSLGDTPITSNGTSVNLPNLDANGNVIADKVIANTVTGTLTTAAQPNITSLGVLTGLELSGNISGTDLQVTGNLDANNINVTETVDANLFTGTFNGPVVSPGSNRQVIFNDGGFDNATAGMTFNKTSNVLSVVGNVTTGNLIASGILTVTSNATLGNVSTTNIIATANIQTVNLTASGNLAVTGNITSGNLQTSGDLSIVGNASMTNITSVNIINANTITANGNVSSGNLLASNNLTVTKTATVGNLITPGDLTVSGIATITGNVSGNNASFAGNISGFNGNLTGNLSVGGNVSASNVSLTGKITATSTGQFGNVITPGDLSVAGNAAITGNISGGNLFIGNDVVVSNDVTASGDLFITGNSQIVGNIYSGNISTGIINATGNITGNVIFGTLFNGNGASLYRITGANVTGVVANANYSAYAGNSTTSNTAITVTGNAQPNITGLGTLTSLAVSGNAAITGAVTISSSLNSGNLSVTGTASVTGNLTSGNLSTQNINAPGTVVVGSISAALFTGSGANLTNLPGPNVLGVVANANYSAYAGNSVTSGSAINVTGNAQPNITSLGSLTSVDVTGSGTVGNNLSVTNRITGGSLVINTDASVSGNLLAGSANVTQLTVLGNVTAANVVSSKFFGSGANLTNLPGPNVLGVVANANYSAYAGNANTSNTAVMVTGNSQPNINLVGTLNGLTVSGTATLSTLAVTGFTYWSVSYGVAAAGNSISTATALTRSVNVVTTSTLPNAKGVILPAAYQGMVVTVINASSNSIDVYPALAASIDSFTTNAPFPLGAGARLQFIAVTPTKWYSMTAVFG